MTTIRPDQIAEPIVVSPAGHAAGEADRSISAGFQSVRINDPGLQREIDAIISHRQQCGGDRYDEVWNGVYVMAPMANDDHQFFVQRFATILDMVLGMPGEAEVRPGINVSDREEDWQSNYRIPDVAVFLKETKAKNCDTFWLGGPEFMIEITSPYDQSHEKLPFYFDVGVEEILIVNRQRWQLELYRRGEDALEQAGLATVENDVVLTRIFHLPVVRVVVVADGGC